MQTIGIYHIYVPTPTQKVKTSSVSNQWNYEMTSHTTCYNVIYLWAKETNQELEETNKEI